MKSLFGSNDRVSGNYKTLPRRTFCNRGVIQISEGRSRVQSSQAMRLLEKVKDRNAFALAALRVAVGLLFVIFGEYKVFGTTFMRHGGFEWWINRFLQEGSAYPVFAPILRNLVLPHASTIAAIVAYGEFAIGLSLVTGILARSASAFGAVYMSLLLLSSNYPGKQAPLWEYFGASLDHSVLLLCFLSFIIGRSEEHLSLKKLFAHQRR